MNCDRNQNMNQNYFPVVSECQVSLSQRLIMSQSIFTQLQTHNKLHKFILLLQRGRHPCAILVPSLWSQLLQCLHCLPTQTQTLPLRHCCPPHHEYYPHIDCDTSEPSTEYHYVAASWASAAVCEMTFSRQFHESFCEPGRNWRTPGQFSCPTNTLGSPNIST